MRSVPDHNVGRRSEHRVRTSWRWVIHLVGGLATTLLAAALIFQVSSNGLVVLVLRAGVLLFGGIQLLEVAISLGLMFRNLLRRPNRATWTQAGYGPWAGVLRTSVCLITLPLMVAIYCELVLFAYIIAWVAIPAAGQSGIRSAVVDIAMAGIAILVVWAGLIFLFVIGALAFLLLRAAWRKLSGQPLREFSA